VCEALDKFAAGFRMYSMCKIRQVNSQNVDNSFRPQFFVQFLPVSKLLQFSVVHFLRVNCSFLSPCLSNDNNSMSFLD
jgi:hypothetical protein